MKKISIYNLNGRVLINKNLINIDFFNKKDMRIFKNLKLLITNVIIWFIKI